MSEQAEHYDRQRSLATFDYSVIVNDNSTAASNDEADLEERFQKLRRSSAEGLIRRVIIGILWLLVLGSFVLSLLGFIGSLNGSIAVRIVLIVVFVATLIPAVLQAIDSFRKSDSRNAVQSIE